MALGKQLPIRLEPDIDARLQAAAERIGTSKSALIRMLAKTFCDQVIQADGSVQLPVDWMSLLPDADGRSVTHRYPKPVISSAQLNEVTPKVAAVDKAILDDDIARIRASSASGQAAGDTTGRAKRVRRAKA